MAQRVGPREGGDVTLTSRGRTLVSVAKVILFFVGIIALYCLLNLLFGTWDVRG